MVANDLQIFSAPAKRGKIRSTPLKEE